MYRLNQIPIATSAIDAYVATAKSIFVNGDVIVRQFSFRDANEFVAFFRDQTGGIEAMLSTLLQHPDILNALPPAFRATQFPLNLQPCVRTRLELAGTIAAILDQGGAYHNFAGTVHEAEALARDLLSALTLGDASQSYGYYITTPWCPFFMDVAWDYTLFIIDSKNSRLSFLFVTDTD